MKNILVLYYDLDSKKTIAITDSGKRIVISIKPSKLLKLGCLQYGSNYNGAKEAFSKITSSCRKIPICVSVYFRIIFIPTVAERNLDCVYIQFDKIKKIRNNNTGCTVEFKNNINYDLKCSVRTLKLQIERCVQFLDYVTNIHDFQLKD